MSCTVSWPHAQAAGCIKAAASRNGPGQPICTKPGGQRGAILQRAPRRNVARKTEERARLARGIGRVQKGFRRDVGKGVAGCRARRGLAGRERGDGGGTTMVGKEAGGLFFPWSNARPHAVRC